MPENNITGFAYDPSIYGIIKDFVINVSSGPSVQDASVNVLFTITQDLSTNIKDLKFYVDSSLNARDASISNLYGISLKAGDLYPYATNASVGLALLPFATNASVGLALLPFATNASVGIALQPFATNSSIGTAAFAKNASIGGIAKMNYWTGTDASYTALGTYNSSTLYFTT